MSYKDVPPRSKRSVGSTGVAIGDREYWVSTVKLLSPDNPELPYETAIFEGIEYVELVKMIKQHPDEETARSCHYETIQKLMKGEIKLEE